MDRVETEGNEYICVLYNGCTCTMEVDGRQSWGEDKALVMDVPGLCVRNLRRTNRTQDYVRVIRILSLDMSNY
jgi:hypothetical protein